MQILINLTEHTPIFQSENTDPRVRSLMERYIKERFFDALMYQSEVQKDFAKWLEDHQKQSQANLKTKRWEIRKIRQAAEHGINTATLYREMDRLHFDARNNIPNKQVNHELSHLIDMTFINRMANEAQNPDVPVTQRQGLMLFGATLMVGLRTSEWQTARLIRDDPHLLDGESAAYPILIVQTAKTRKEDPEPRILVLEEFDRGALHMIEACIDMTREMNNGSLGQLVSGMRKAMLRLAEDAQTQELLQHVDMKTARKIFTVESRREGRSPESVSAALGHTTTNNLRWYAQGDIYCDRLTDIPLARPAKEATLKIRDPLAELNERKQRQGETPLSGYPDLRDRITPDAPASGQTNSAHWANQLLGGSGND